MTERIKQQQHSSLAKKKMLAWTSAVAVELEKNGEFENTIKLGVKMAKRYHSFWFVKTGDVR